MDHPQVGIGWQSVVTVPIRMSGDKVELRLSPSRTGMNAAPLRAGKVGGLDLLVLLGASDFKLKSGL